MEYGFMYDGKFSLIIMNAVKTNLLPKGVVIEDDFPGKKKLFFPGAQICISNKEVQIILHKKGERGQEDRVIFSRRYVIRVLDIEEKILWKNSSHI